MQPHIRSLALLLALTPATAATAQTNDVLVGPNEGVTFRQVDFHLGPPPLLDSGFGTLEVDPVQLASSTGLNTGFLSLAVLSKPARHVSFQRLPLRWQVKNLYVTTQPSAHYPQVIDDLVVSFPDEPQGISTYFDLGAEPGESVSFLSAYVLFSDEPVRDRTDLQQRIGVARPGLFRVTNQEVSSIGAVEPGDCDPEISVPGPPPLPEPPPDPGALGLVSWVELPNPSNVEAADNQCGPASWANSLQYLEDTFGFDYLFSVPEPNLPGENGDNTLVGVLDAYMNRTVISRCSGAGTNRCTIDAIPSRLPGLMDYLSNTFDITRFSMRHQGREEPVIPDDCTGTYAFGIQSVREGLQPTWEWIRDRLVEGCAVSIAYGRYSTEPVFPCGLGEKRTGGHILRVYKAGIVGGQRWIGCLDDGGQDGLVNGNCTAKGGLRWDRRFWLEDVDQDGRLNLSGMSWELEFAVALHLAAPPL